MMNDNIKACRKEINNDFHGETNMIKQAEYRRYMYLWGGIVEEVVLCARCIERLE